jgi:hypothetical protein
MASRLLTTAVLSLAPQRRQRGLLRWVAALLTSAAAASATTALLMHDGPRAVTTPAPAAIHPGNDALQLQLDQLRLALGVAQARGAELERQIDSLAQRGRQCQEELVFFRQSGRRGAP